MSVELVFLAIWLVFAITGLIRGYKQELGVTIVLLLALSGLELLESQFRSEFNDALTLLVGGGPIYREAIRGLIYSLVLLVAVFLGYQTNFLRFPGGQRSAVLGLSSGMLNGYLLAGSMWYYLGTAGWPYLQLAGSFSVFYRSAWQWLPPNILSWPLLCVGAVGLLVVRLLR